jgi:hypothetical protein
MPLLANENFPLVSVHLLRQAGYFRISIIKKLPFQNPLKRFKVKKPVLMN